MGRIMNTYPVSEPEMEYISSLNAQATTRYAAATFFLGIALSIWINSTFYEQLTEQAIFATRYAAPFLLLLAGGFAIGGSMAQYQRGSVWDRIKSESSPLQAVSSPVVATAEASRTAA
jgi:hypothetical protein